MKRTELIKRLIKQGAVLARHGGKHDVYIQPRTGMETTVPRHEEIKEFTAKSILRTLS